MKHFTAFVSLIFLVVLGLGVAACAPTADQMLASQLAQARDNGNPLVVYAYGVPGQIRVGVARTAVPVYIQFIVTGERSVQQVRFLFVGNSIRGHPVRDGDGKIRALVLTGLGPFDPGKNYEVNSFYVHPAGFPGGNVACVELLRMELSYSDGSHQVYAASALGDLLLPALRRHCEDQGPRVYRIAG